MNSKNWVIAGHLCLVMSMLCAQDSTEVEQLKEVVVSDSRFQLDRENSGKTVIKISKQEIENNQGRTVAQLINTKSGIEINGSRSVEGQNLGYFIRGGNNRQVLVMIDGIQVNDPSLVSNDFDLRLLDLNTIESIEIIKGASSTLYGNAAATAVIHITTKKASDKKVAINVSSLIGTNQPENDQAYNVNGFVNAVSISGTLGKLNYLASFGNRFADGLSAAAGENAERDPFSRFNTKLQLGYRFSESFSIKSFIGLDKFKTAIDGFPPPTFTFADTDDQFFSEQLRFGITPEFKYNNGSVTVNAALTKIDRETLSSFPTVNEAESIVIDAFNKYVFNDTFYTVIGLNYGDYQSVFAEEESFNVVDPYLNMVYVSDFGLNVNAGGRLNNHSEYGSQFVYHLNPSFRKKVGSGYAKLFGSYATSFIAPNLSQLFGAFGPNPDLEPEENITIEGGLEYIDNKGFRINGVFFTRDEENTIIFTDAYENAAEAATVQGVEIETLFSAIKHLTIAANYTFTELKEGLRLRLPKHKANLNLGYNISAHWFASLNYQFTGSRTDTNFSSFTNEELDAFSLIDVYFSHHLLNNKVKFFLNVTNVLNEDYLEIIGYTTRGRNVSLGINLNL